MNRGPSLLEPEGLVEPLDIDLESLDHALMDLLTSDWQSLVDERSRHEDLATQRLDRT